MLYDLSNSLDRTQFLAKVDWLISKGKRVNLSEERMLRTRSQNSYLHLLLGMVALEVGEDVDMVKDYHFKQLINKDLFQRETTDKLGNRIVYYRSTADLNTAEMTQAIDTMRAWASRELGMYLPAPNEEALLREADRMIATQRRY